MYVEYRYEQEIVVGKRPAFSKLVRLTQASTLRATLIEETFGQMPCSVPQGGFALRRPARTEWWRPARPGDRRREKACLFQYSKVDAGVNPTKNHGKSRHLAGWRSV